MHTFAAPLAANARSYESPLVRLSPAVGGVMGLAASTLRQPFEALERYVQLDSRRSVKPLAVVAKSTCANCGARHACMPPELSAAGVEAFSKAFGNTRRVKRGEAIYRAGDVFHNLYVARAGSSKTIAVYRDGRQQITGFQISGEFLGMDGIGTGKHTVDAVALEDSVMCVIAFKELEGLCDENKAMQHHVHKLMSREIVRESGLLMMMGNLTAEERVAAFLLNLSQRFQDRGYSPAEFQLRMTREEIGCHLGLTLETVSRMFSKLQRQGLIDMRGKQAKIVDLEGLGRI